MRREVRCSRAGHWFELVFVHGGSAVHGVLILQLELEGLFVGIFLMDRLGIVNEGFF